MARSIYITTTEPRSGKSLISLGIANIALRQTSRLGVFRPIIDAPTPEHRDKNIDLLLSYFELRLDYEDTYAYLEEEAVALLGQGKESEFFDGIIQKYKKLESQCDFILCIGSDFEGEESAVEADLNAQIAKQLGCPVLIVSRGDRRNVAHVQNMVRATLDIFQAAGCHVVGIVVNRTQPENMTALTAVLQESLAEEQIFPAVLPADPHLSSPTLSEIVEQLNLEVLYGEDQLHRLAYHNLIVAMQVRNYLPYLRENALLITAGDRDDIVLSALQAHQSRSYPRLAGIVLTGGLKPSETVTRLIDGLEDVAPIFSSATDTFTTAQAAAAVRSYITASTPAKIRLSLELFEQYVDIEAMESHYGRVEAPGLPPRLFLYNLVERARSTKQHIVLPEGMDERILQAAEILLRRDIVDLTILGDPTEVRGLIRRLGLKIDLDRLPIIDPKNSPQLEEYTQTLYELRKDKGLTLEAAHDLMCDVSYYGTMMVYKGHADGMVSGAMHTTAHTIRPALQFIKTKPGFTVVSSVFFMALDNRVLVYGDCAVNPNPTAPQLAEIAISSADTALAFGVEPRVAMLSYSTGESGEGEEVDKVRKATRLAQERRPDLVLEGPMQYDAAVSAEVAAKKMPGSRVAGRATVLIFPDLNTGNNTYKAVQRETGAIAIGPVLQGLRKPVNDLSRGCTVEDVVNTVAITAIQAQNT